MVISKDLPKSIHSKREISIKCDKCNNIFERRYDVYYKSNYSDFCKKCIRKICGKKKKGISLSKEHKEKISKSKKKNARPKLTITCQCCQKEFVVKYAERKRMFCSKSCALKSRERPDSRVASKCIICNKEFLHYGTKILCSRACNAKYMSQTRIGENNPAFNPDKKNISICYPTDFKKIKKTIRNQDDYCCRLCGEYNKNIPVHHVDYNKNNNDPSNLVCLCKRCHGLTNFERPFWQILFAGLLSKSKIVKKGWGVEIHIVNNDKYCLKYLVFWKGKRFSHHFHNIKQEAWHCIMGGFNLILETQNGQSSESSFNAGDKIEINPGHIHQLIALKNSIITEISTRDFPEDSIRIQKGD